MWATSLSISWQKRGEQTSMSRIIAGRTANGSPQRRRIKMATARSTTARKAPAKRAPAKKTVATATVPVAKKVYAATGRGGVERRSTSATVLTHAVDVKISGRKGPQFAAGVVVAFYSSRAAAEKVVTQINGGNVADWSDAKIVTATAVSA
jgi:hypothetical protein